MTLFLVDPDAAAGGRRLGHGRVPDRRPGSRHGPPDRLPELRDPGLARVDRAPAVRRPGLPDEPAAGDHGGRGRGRSRGRGPAADGQALDRPGDRADARLQPALLAPGHSRRPAHVPPGPRRGPLHAAADVGAAAAGARIRRSLRHADRWLVAAALFYGVAVANHSLALLLPPAIGLFVLAVDWRVVLRWRTVLACVGVLAGDDGRALPGAADPGGDARPARLRPPGHPAAASPTSSWPSSSAAAWSIRSATCGRRSAPSST